jgi:uncharacterized membrane protein (UPF0127 family)
MYRSFIFFILILCFSSLGSCSANELRTDCEVTVRNERNKERKIKVQISKTEAERNLGLMYRDKMPLDHGMLFVFPEEEERSFWMKNTFISLDIIFIDQKQKVTTVLMNVPPHTTSPRRSNAPAKYVIELNSGMAKEYEIEVNTTIDISECSNE